MSTEIIGKATSPVREGKGADAHVRMFDPYFFPRTSEEIGKRNEIVDQVCEGLKTSTTLEPFYKMHRDMAVVEADILRRFPSSKDEVGRMMELPKARQEFISLFPPQIRGIFKMVDDRKTIFRDNRYNHMVTEQKNALDEYQKYHRKGCIGKTFFTMKKIIENPFYPWE